MEGALGEVAERVELHADDGSIRVNVGRATEVDLRTGCGTVEATLGNIGDPVEVHSDDGSIRVKLHSASNVRLHTGSGEVVLEITNAVRETVEVESDDGSIRLKVPDSLDFRIEAETDDGHVRCSLPVGSVETESNDAGERYAAVRNEGTVAVRLRTGSGDITVHN